MVPRWILKERDSVIGRYIDCSKCQNRHSLHLGLVVRLEIAQNTPKILKSTPTYLSNRRLDQETQVTLGHLHLMQIAMHTSNVSLLRVLFEIETH